MSFEKIDHRENPRRTTTRQAWGAWSRPGGDPRLWGWCGWSGSTRRVDL